MKKVVSEISGTVFSLPWLIAKDHGLFEAEGIEMEFVRARPSGVVPHTENPAEVNPVLGHVAFEKKARSGGPMRANREQRSLPYVPRW
jgi:NitT/TauT family transport system substrate-binding protein